MIRYNPDAFKLNQSAIKTRYPPKMRLKSLGETLKAEFEDTDFAENLFTLQYLFYDNTEGSETIQTYKFKTLEEYAKWMNERLKEDKEHADKDEEKGETIKNDEEGNKDDMK